MKPIINITNESIKVETESFEMMIYLKPFNNKEVVDLRHTKRDPVEICPKCRQIKSVCFCNPEPKKIDEYDDPLKTNKGTSASSGKAKGKRGGFNTTKIRTCHRCGKDFKPRGNRQNYCSEACGLKPKKYMRKKHKLTPEKEAELNKTLAEIEERRLKPYQVGN